MGYIQEVLGEGERVEYCAKISQWNFVGWYALIILLGLAFMGSSAAGEGPASIFLLGVMGFIAARIAITYYCTELALTNRRVIVKTGFISRYTVEISLPKVESIQIAQSILGRLLNYGTVIVNGSGTGHAPIKGIENPLGFRRKFDEISAARP